MDRSAHLEPDQLRPAVLELARGVRATAAHAVGALVRGDVDLALRAIANNRAVRGFYDDLEVRCCSLPRCRLPELVLRARLFELNTSM